MLNPVFDRVARRLFGWVNQHRYDELLAACAPDVVHRFSGEHALSGVRRGRRDLGRWFERLGRLCPDLAVVVHDVWASGLPHRATMVVRWTASMPLPDGSTYRSHGVHVIRTRGAARSRSTPTRTPRRSPRCSRCSSRTA